MRMARRVDPEWLDELPAHDPRAQRSRRDLVRINALMGNVQIERKGALLEKRVRTAIDASGWSDRVSYVRLGSLSTLFFAAGDLTDFTAVKRSDTATYAKFFHAMLRRGVFLPPAQFEAWFVSTAHEENDLKRTARAVEASLREIDGGESVR